MLKGNAYIYTSIHLRQQIFA